MKSAYLVLYQIFCGSIETGNIKLERVNCNTTMNCDPDSKTGLYRENCGNMYQIKLLYLS